MREGKGRDDERYIVVKVELGGVILESIKVKHTGCWGVGCIHAHIMYISRVTQGNFFIGSGYKGGTS